MPGARGKRSSSSFKHTDATSKKFCSAIDETVTEFICPISQELPLDPVTAEDGRVYEKASIEEWLAQKQTSPVTNVAMGTRLLPAVQVRSVIRNLVQSGAISGDKADKWQQRIAEEKEFVDTRKRAEDGDCNAMNFLGIFYNQGTGVRKDVNQARRWYRKSAELGEVRGLTNLAVISSSPNSPESPISPEHTAHSLASSRPQRARASSARRGYRYLHTWRGVLLLGVGQQRRRRLRT